MTDTLKTPDVAEMTRFLAVEVMGWTRVVIRRCEVQYCLPIKGTGWKVFAPDTVPADRDMLVEAMRGKGFLVDVLTRLNGERQALVYMDEKEGDVFSDVANTPGRVVLTAAYQAVKGMEEQHHDT